MCAIAEYKQTPCPPETTKLFLVRNDLEACGKCDPFKTYWDKGEGGWKFNAGEGWDLESVGLRRCGEYMEEKKRRGMKEGEKEGEEEIEKPDDGDVSPKTMCD